MNCDICGDDIEGYGNNADPVTEGICCDTCNFGHVIPERLKIMTEDRE